MTHTHHESAPNYHPSQVLHEGCEECELRGRDLQLWLGHVDTAHWARAWQRAIAFTSYTVDNVSAAEAPLLRTLGALAVGFQSLGFPVDLIDYMAQDHSGWTRGLLAIVLRSGRELGEVDAQALAQVDGEAPEGIEVNLSCGDTITVPTEPAIGAYRKCIHCDARKRVTAIVSH